MAIVSVKSRRHAGVVALVLAAVCAACGSSASVAPSLQPTPSPTPAGGEHQFVVAGLPIDVTATVPPGWEDGGSTVSRPTAEDATPMAVSAWVIGGVYADPCHWDGAIEEVGPTSQEVAAALAAQPTRRARESTVDLGGYTAYRVIMSVPHEADLAACDEGEFRSWADSAGRTARVQDGPGQIDEVYVVDVNGTPVVIDVAYFPDASTEEIAELHRIIASLQFEVPEATAAPSG